VYFGSLLGDFDVFADFVGFTSAAEKSNVTKRVRDARMSSLAGETQVVSWKAPLYMLAVISYLYSRSDSCPSRRKMTHRAQKLSRRWPVSRACIGQLVIVRDVIDRYWLVDCDSDGSSFAHRLFTRLLHVPFVAKFAVFARVTSDRETRLRVFCVTDDQLDKTLERHQNYREIARSQHVEVVHSHCVSSTVGCVAQRLQRWSLTGELSCSTLDPQLTGDHLCV